ncbi:MAG TPA: peptidoglycan DD-metalloendopeptidase family protein [Moraxellaceae bacterium]|nr:peptidoglycan DD-metalloendopeptidase family protein [Moraxellaceae bacterium]
MPLSSLRTPLPRWLPLLMLGGLLALVPGLASSAEATNSSTHHVKAGAVKKKATKKAAKKSSSHASSGHKSAHASPRKGSKATATNQRDLAKIQEEIRTAEQNIRLTREQREQKEAELQKAELEISSLRENMGSVQRDVSSREQRLQSLQAEKVKRETDKGRLVNQVRSDLQMAQRQGGDDSYKLLLNQQSPQDMARLMKYYGYMQKARADRVKSLNETLARLAALQSEEEDNVGKLRNLRGELQQKQTKLSAAQTQRSETIRTLNAQLESQDERLQRLHRDEQALQSVMDRLARESAAREQKAREQAREQREREQREAEKRQQQATSSGSESRPAESRPTESRPAEGRPVTPSLADTEPHDFAPVPYKGHCPLPTAGGVRARFGSARAGGLRWNGIVIDAPAGTAVRAIRPGRVAFADYLRGYGFLIIVDHGRGLMSLYGQNRSLGKKAGDAVAANEVIASVGDGGGSETNGLYFEIRVRGKPSDPAEWCAYQ